MTKGILLCFLLGVVGSFSVARAQGYDPVVFTVCAEYGDSTSNCYAESVGYTGYMEVDIAGQCYYTCLGEGYPAASSYGFWACAYIIPIGVASGVEDYYDDRGIEIGYVQVDTQISSGGLFLATGFSWQDCFYDYDSEPAGFDCP